MTKVNRIGMRFGKLVVIAACTCMTNNRIFCLCQCDCGKRKLIRWSSLKSEFTKSCGCYRSERISKINFKYGDCNNKIISIEYITWWSMIQRCTNTNHKNYNSYGGRGINVCKRWMSFKNFLSDMGRKPNVNLTLERINNNNGYFKQNCKWATKSEQAKNRRSRLRDNLGRFI